ncbi:hypothetical protein L249_3031 [Ophiocordyceps polyrhachis-furcata BCC 54312]|uniref:Uncharacterized protein n=1 Tax=Ophiocordyceps polyrhachis-furcata BCC 54312 TaxID=1330021 RepID=A0A367LQV9_9HYPO|nr:hypothetical protein L249_3031 [Ophiocordyceps polyrhachis-furcata BCC 54312]
MPSPITAADIILPTDETHEIGHDAKSENRRESPKSARQLDCMLEEEARSSPCFLSRHALTEPLCLDPTAIKSINILERGQSMTANNAYDRTSAGVPPPTAYNDNYMMCTYAGVPDVTSLGLWLSCNIKGRPTLQSHSAYSAHL